MIYAIKISRSSLAIQRSHLPCLNVFSLHATVLTLNQTSLYFAIYANGIITYHPGIIFIRFVNVRRFDDQKQSQVLCLTVYTLQTSVDPLHFKWNLHIRPNEDIMMGTLKQLALYRRDQIQNGVRWWPLIMWGMRERLAKSWNRTCLCKHGIGRLEVYLELLPVTASFTPKIHWRFMTIFV